jgi:hypothetical protein
MAQVHEASIEGLTTMVNRERMAQSGHRGFVSIFSEATRGPNRHP